MLESYYDVNQTENFEQLFGDLYIGKNPTPERNHYLILRFDFSGIVTGQGKERFYESFDSYITTKVNLFLKRYLDLFHIDELPESNRRAESAITFLDTLLHKKAHKIYILIDEYDNFANNLIKPTGAGSDDMNYNTMVKSESYLRTFYKTLKQFVQNQTAHVFMTGVSPIMLDDLASGFNITTNITTNKDFNEMVGFTEEEVINILKQTGIDDTDLWQHHPLYRIRAANS